MRVQTGKKIKFKRSIISVIHEQGLYNPHDITYIFELCKEKGLKTSRGELYKAFTFKVDISPIHADAIKIAEDYFRTKLRMSRAFRKKYGLPENIKL